MQKLADAEAKKERQQGKRNDLLGGNSTKLGGKNTVQHILRRLARDHERASKGSSGHGSEGE